MFACRFSDNGKYLAHAVLDTISIHDAASGALLTRASEQGAPDDVDGPFYNNIRHYTGSDAGHDFRELPDAFPLCGGDPDLPAFIAAVQSDGFERASTGDLGGARAFISPYRFIAVQSNAAFAARCAGPTDDAAGEDVDPLVAPSPAPSGAPGIDQTGRPDAVHGYREAGRRIRRQKPRLTPDLKERRMEEESEGDEEDPPRDTGRYAPRVGRLHRPPSDTARRPARGTRARPPSCRETSGTAPV